MNKEVEKIFTERGFTNIEQMATMFDWYKEEIERLTAESTKWESKFYDEAKKVDKAIEYIDEILNSMWHDDKEALRTLENILKGVNNEQ